MGKPRSSIARESSRHDLVKRSRRKKPGCPEEQQFGQISFQPKESEDWTNRWIRVQNAFTDDLKGVDLKVEKDLEDRVLVGHKGYNYNPLKSCIKVVPPPRWTKRWIRVLNTFKYYNELKGVDLKVVEEEDDRVLVRVQQYPHVHTYKVPKSCVKVVPHPIDS